MNNKKLSDQIDIKIIWSETIYNDDDYYSQNILRQAITDWETVSREDYNFLVENKWHLRVISDHPRLEPIILVKNTDPIPDTIQNLRQFILDEKLRLAMEAEKREAEKQRKAALRRAKNAAKDAAGDLALLEEIAKKHGLTILPNKGNSNA